METAVCKLQAEMQKLVQDRDQARKETRQALAQSRRHRKGEMDGSRAVEELKRKPPPPPNQTALFEEE